MQRLQKASLSYIRDEDRICLRGQISQQHILFLWLTHRLVRQLVPHLINSTRRLSCEDELARNSGQSQEDFSAEHIEPVPEFPGLRDDILVIGIQLRSSSEHVELTFRSDKSLDESQIILSLYDVQKLLDGLKDCFEQAAWPCDIWREVTAEVALDSSSPVTLH